MKGRKRHEAGGEVVEMPVAVEAPMKKGGRAKKATGGLVPSGSAPMASAARAGRKSGGMAPKGHSSTKEC